MGGEASPSRKPCQIRHGSSATPSPRGAPPNTPAPKIPAFAGMTIRASGI